ncbi:MAG: LPS export ABC transporter periplasmic protein LptC [Candidatus Aureabacteria bacterium]|nr:LPS export ABC transporter periplasmic protein LptC [Candidatus Auribacterota bacterium]
MRTGRELLILGFIIACAALACAEEPSKSELRDGFMFNSTKKDGRVEWKVEGSSATFVTPETVEIKDVRAVYFNEDGTNTIATTEKATLQQETRQVHTDEFVTIVTKNSVVTATGMDWDQMKKRGTLRHDVKVVYTTPKGEGILQ